jgi:hypothetical protein
VLTGAGKSLIDLSNGCTFVIGSVRQRPTKIHLGNVGSEEESADLDDSDGIATLDSEMGAP